MSTSKPEVILEIIEDPNEETARSPSNADT
jgi:hypothetical protein